MIRTQFRRPMWATFGRLALPVLPCLLMLPNLSGCALFGIVADRVLPPPTIAAKYKGLAGQTVAVMVWTDDSGVRIDWPQVNLDLAQLIQNKLQVAQSSAKPAELLKTTFPVNPASVARLQEEDPDLAAQDITEAAPKLHVSRLIYVEIHGLQTRSDAAVELFRGAVSGSVKVVEVTNGKARVAFTDDDIHVVFPKNVPEEGTPNFGDYKIYRGVLDAFSTEVAVRFFSHEDPDQR